MMLDLELAYDPFFEAGHETLAKNRGSGLIKSELQIN